MTDDKRAIQVLTLNTIAFTVCFAVWTMNGVLVTYLIDQGVFAWDKAQIGWLIGIPIFTGAITRLPIGVLTDKYGGRLVYTLLMILSAIPTYLLSYATTYEQFILASLGFGLSGASFAVGVAYTSLWFKKERQGTALGIFGIGNIGSALTSFGAPMLLKYLTDDNHIVDNWKVLPKIYAIVLVITAVGFYFLTFTKKAEEAKTQTLGQRLSPLKYARVWRFGLYYFVVFGGFVALAQWLIPYYVNAYSMSIATAGMMASFFSTPSAIIRAVGGWLSDKYGPRTIMYWVFSACLISFVLLCVPRMDIQSPGQGIMSDKAGEVTNVTREKIIVGEKEYVLLSKPDIEKQQWDQSTLVWPTFTFWQEPIVNNGDKVVKRQLLAKGITHIYFQANVWIFSALVFLMAIAMGTGMGAVFKFIPEYYPTQVGVVGGIVGVIGGLGGFFYPIIFGYLLKSTGIWTTAWMFFFIITVIAFAWLHITVRKIMRDNAASLIRQLESSQPTVDKG